MIPLFDLKAQHEIIRPDLDAALRRVLDSGRFILGDEVAAFEGAFAALCGVRHAVAVNSGTSALHLALVAAGVGPGDEVITVPMTFVATVDAIRYTGARPVLADIEAETWTLDPGRVEAALTPRTRAIVPVHLHGLAADMDPIAALAEPRGVTVIEDAAQAHGAEYKGRRAGSLGDLGCFSFYPSKNLGALGDAGAVVTDDADRAAALRMLRDCGRGPDRHHRVAGYNYRMDAFQGAILSAKMAHLEGWTEARRRHAARYDAAVACTDVEAPPRPRRPPPRLPHLRRSGGPARPSAERPRRARRRDRGPLSGPGPLAGAVRRPRVPRGRFPGFRAARERASVATPFSRR